MINYGREVPLLLVGRAAVLLDPTGSADSVEWGLGSLGTAVSSADSPRASRRPSDSLSPSDPRLLFVAQRSLGDGAYTPDARQPGQVLFAWARARGSCVAASDEHGGGVCIACR